VFVLKKNIFGILLFYCIYFLTIEKSNFKWFL
jgi:hypothetical protein